MPQVLLKSDKASLANCLSGCLQGAGRVPLLSNFGDLAPSWRSQDLFYSPLKINTSTR